MENKRYVIINTSISQDGLGIPAVSVYFSYCDKKEKTGSFCPMCHNSQLQKDGVGNYLSLDEIIKHIQNKYDYLKSVFGKATVAIMGGEPLAEINLPFVQEIAKKFDVIIYTWRMPEDIKAERIDISNFDRVVCGEYIDELNKGDDYVLGSINQRVIDGEGNMILKYEGSVK